MERPRLHRQRTESPVLERRAQVVEQTPHERPIGIGFGAEVVGSIAHVGSGGPHLFRRPDIALPQFEEPSVRGERAQAGGNELAGQRVQHHVHTEPARDREDLVCECERPRIERVLHAERTQALPLDR